MVGADLRFFVCIALGVAFSGCYDSLWGIAVVRGEKSVWLMFVNTNCVLGCCLNYLSIDL